MNKAGRPASAASFILWVGINFHSPLWTCSQEVSSIWKTNLPPSYNKKQGADYVKPDDAPLGNLTALLNPPGTAIVQVGENRLSF